MQNLQCDDLVWLVEYLDKVRRRAAFPALRLSYVGSRWSRDLRSRFPEVSARTQEYMQYMGGAPGIVHTFVFPSKH